MPDHSSQRRCERCGGLDERDWAKRLRPDKAAKVAPNHGARYDRWVAATTKPLDILAVVFLADFAATRLTPADSSDR